MNKLLVLVAAIVCAAPADAQTLAEAARRAEETRKAAGATSVTFDMRDIDPALARQELVGARLDEALWPKFLAADKAFAAALDSSADLRQRYQAVEFANVRALEKFIFRERPLADAVTGAGLQLREFAATHLAMVLALQEGRGTAAAVESLPPAIRENVTFVRAHEREIKALATPAAKLNVRVAPMDRAVPTPAANTCCSTSGAPGAVRAGRRCRSRRRPTRASSRAASRSSGSTSRKGRRWSRCAPTSTPKA